MTAQALTGTGWTAERVLVAAFTTGWVCPNFGFATDALRLRQRKRTPPLVPPGEFAVFDERFGIVRAVFVSDDGPGGRVVACGTWSVRRDAVMRLGMLWQLRDIVPEMRNQALRPDGMQ